MTDGAVMILVDGSIMTRSQVVESLGYAPPWRTYDIEDVRLIRLGTDAATLVYAAHAYRDGVEPALTAVMTSTWVRHDGRWRLGIYTQTRLP